MKVLAVLISPILDHTIKSQRAIFITPMKNISCLYVLIATQRCIIRTQFRYCLRSNREFEQCRAIFNVQSCSLEYTFIKINVIQNIVYFLSYFSAILNLITIIDSIFYTAQIKWNFVVIWFRHRISSK